MSKKQLKSLLNNADVETRVEAARELIELGEPVDSVLPMLVDAIRELQPEDEWPYFPFYLTWAFHAVGSPGIKAVADRASDASLPSIERVHLVRFLQTYFGEVKLAAGQLASIIDSTSDNYLRAWAEVALYGFSDVRVPPSEALIEAAASEKDSALRGAALDCLQRANLNGDYETLVKEASLSALTDPSFRVCQQASRNLQESALTANEWHQVYAILDGPNAGAVLRLVHRRKKPPQRILPGVLAALRTAGEDDIEIAEDILVKIGKPTEMPLLDLAADNKEPDRARSSAFATLCKMPAKSLSKASMTRLQKLASSKTKEIRIQASTGLARHGTSLAKMLPTVVEALTDEDWNAYTRLAKRVVASLPAETVMPYLIERYRKIRNGSQAANFMHFFMDVGKNSRAASEFIIEQLRFAEGFYDANMLHNAVRCVEYPIIPLLVNAVDDANSKRKYEQVARLLEGMSWRVYADPDETLMIEVATRLLDSHSADIAFAAARLLVRYKSAPQQACEIYMSSTVPKATFARNVEDLKKNPIAALKRMFEVKDIYTRSEQVQQRLLEIAVEVVPRMLETADNDDETKHDVIDVLGHVGPVCPEVIEYLCERLDERQHFEWAVRALSNAPEAGPAVTKIQRMLDGQHQLEAVKSLGDIGAASREALPDLIRLLSSKEPALLAEVVETLGKLGTTSKRACRRILKLTQSDNRDVALNAIDALATCQIPEAVPRLLELASDWREHAAVLTTLAAYEPLPRQGWRILRGALQDADRIYAPAIAVARLGPKARRLLSELLDVLPKVEITYFSHVTNAIVSMGKHARPALPVLETYLRSHYHSIGPAIWNISPDRARELRLADVYV